MHAHIIVVNTNHHVQRAHTMFSQHGDRRSVSQ